MKTAQGQGRALQPSSIPAPLESSRVPTPARSTSIRSHSNLTLELHPVLFRCAWLLVVGLHVLCAVYLTQLARVYKFLMHPYMMYWALLATGDQYQYLRHAGVGFAVVAALHWWQLLSILWESVRLKKLVLPNGASGLSSYVMRKIAMAQGEWSHQGSTRVQSLYSSILLQKLALPSQLLMRGWKLLFSRTGMFGVESKVFNAVFTLRELAEIVSQTFQARRSSELLSRPWLNHLVVALIVLNCWSTPVAQHFLNHRRQGLDRVVCFLLDVLLNIGSSMAIPLAVFLPYYHAISHDAFKFPAASLFDAVWVSRLVMENQLLFSVSIADIFSKFIPHLGIYCSLASVVVLIRRKRDDQPLKARIAAQPQTGIAWGDQVEATGDTTGKLQPVHASRRMENAAHLFFFAWGAALAGIHIRAVLRSQHDVPGCRLTGGSWFADGFPCSVYDYNCNQQGTESPSEESLKQLGTETLVYLNIAHCPELRVPSRLQSFSNIVGFHIHSSTIVEWSKENAVSATKHTQLIAVTIGRTNMTRIPDGLLQPLPGKLLNIQITHSNLSSLPSDLHEKWHPMAVLYLEHAMFREFPKTLLSLPVRELSLHGNLIETLPELTDLHQQFNDFTVTANPLKELPETLGEGTEFSFFGAERTLLKTLPAWVHTSVQDTMYLYGTPYCGDQGEDKADGSAYLACVKRVIGPNGMSPVDIFDTQLPL